jgi:dTDP-4-dehydrorhamnose reductase
MLQTLITTDKFGIWNISNGGKSLNRYELVNYLKDYLKSNIEVIPTKTSQENIKRPLNSAFDLEALIKNNLQLPNWQKSLDSFLKSYLLELK